MHVLVRQGNHLELPAEERPAAELLPLVWMISLLSSREEQARAAHSQEVPAAQS